MKIIAADMHIIKLRRKLSEMEDAIRCMAW